MKAIGNHLDVSVEGAVLLAGLNRSKKRSAMTLEMMRELRETFSNIPVEWVLP